MENISSIYQQKCISPQDLVTQIGNGWNCCTDIAASIPTTILNCLGERASAGAVTGIHLHTFLDIQPLGSLLPDAFPGITPVSWFS